MNRACQRILAVGIAALAALCGSGCAPPIPHEEVPDGWALNVHQPGEWWTQPLIPRSVVMQRCPQRFGWASDPDLTRVTALPPGTSIEYSFLTDDYHCSIGWSQPASEVKAAAADLATEVGLRRICSFSGLPMDAGWRFLGHKPTEGVGDLPDPRASGIDTWDSTTAAFVDEYGTVVGCLVDHLGEAGTTRAADLSVGADGPATPNGAACPVESRDMARNDDGAVDEYQLRGAGAVRGQDGRVLTRAATLRIGLVGDSVTTSHPVVDGIAIVDARVKPKAAVHFEWDDPPPVEGTIYDAAGRLMATCRG